MLTDDIASGTPGPFLQENLMRGFDKLLAAVVVSTHKLRLAPLAIHKFLFAYPKYRAGWLVREPVPIEFELAVIYFHMHGLLHRVRGPRKRKRLKMGAVFAS